MFHVLLLEMTTKYIMRRVKRLREQHVLLRFNSEFKKFTADNTELILLKKLNKTYFIMLIKV